MKKYMVFNGETKEYFDCERDAVRYAINKTEFDNIGILHNGMYVSADINRELMFIRPERNCLKCTHCINSDNGFICSFNKKQVSENYLCKSFLSIDKKEISIF